MLRSMRTIGFKTLHLVDNILYYLKKERTQKISKLNYIEEKYRMHVNKTYNYFFVREKFLLLQNFDDSSKNFEI